MRRLAIWVLATPLVATACMAKTKPTCGQVIGEIELYARLKEDPYFVNGVPPPNKQMKVEREACGYRIYVGVGSAESFGGDLLIVDANGKITEIVARP